MTTKPDYQRIIPRVLKQGRRRAGKFLSLHRLISRPATLSIVVSKKLSNKAVLRNRTRRVLYGALHPLFFELTTPEQVVALARQVLDTKGKSQAAQDEAKALFSDD